MKAPSEMELAIFDVATSLAHDAQRLAFLDEVCIGKPERRKRLERLLAIHQQADSFFKGAAPALALAAESLSAALPVPAEKRNAPALFNSEQPGIWIGRYQLVEKIGEGGGGVVWLAEQSEPVRRTVALKVIRLGMDTENVIARFEIERQSLALMDHPNIARVLEAGATAAGRPFFVMEWVRGSPITTYCDQSRLDLAQRIRLFIQVCHAIQHAHQKGVIHRDIKPSNILVASHDGKAEPKVIDFGIAKATTGHESSEHRTTSHAGFWLGTPAYMSPEQADEKTSDIDTRSDVYSLGILLYELLAGYAPYDAKELAKVGVSEARKILIEREPALPSVILASNLAEKRVDIAEHRSTQPHKLISTLRGDLDSVVMKAIAKDRTQRYDTVNGLALDLQRFLQNEPVYARPPSRIDRLRKLYRRNRGTFAAAAMVFFSVLAGLAVATGFYFREREARQEQSRLRVIAERARAVEKSLREAAIVRENISRAAVLLSEGKTEEANVVLHSTPLSSAEPSREAAGVLRSLGEWSALRSRWNQAADCFMLLDQANAIESPNHLIFSRDLLVPGPCLIESGRWDDYEVFRKRILARFGGVPHPQASEQTVKAILLRPIPRDSSPALEALERSLSDSLEGQNFPPGRDTMLAAWRAWALHLVKFRCGDDAGSVQWARKIAEFSDKNLSRDAMIHAVLAMIHHRQGDQQSAEANLIAARNLVAQAFTPHLAPVGEPMGAKQGWWWDWLIARILLREAEASMKPASSGVGR